MPGLDASTASAGGATSPVAQVVFPPSAHHRKIWRINHTGPANSKVGVYEGAVISSQFRDGSSSGVQDVAEYPNGLEWPAGAKMIWQWDTPGAATVHLQVSDA